MRAVVALTLSASVVLGLAGESRPAARSWPGTNGKIAFTRFAPAGNSIFFIRPSGTGESRLASPWQTADVAWSRDGKRIAFTARTGTEQGVYVASATGKRPKRLTRNTFTEVYDTAPFWSPDGRTILFQRNRGQRSEIYVVGVRGGQARKVGEGYGPSFSPDGRRLLFAFRPPGGNTDVYVTGADGRGKRRLTESASMDFDADWSPDGKRIVFVSDRDGNYEIYVMRADGSGERRLTFVPVSDANPVWSPDGRKIAFASRRVLGRLDVFVMNADGKRQRRVTRSPHDDADPSWQPLRRR